MPNLKLQLEGMNSGLSSDKKTSGNISSYTDRRPKTTTTEDYSYYPGNKSSLNTDRSVYLRPAKTVATEESQQPEKFGFKFSATGKGGFGYESSRNLQSNQVSWGPADFKKDL